MFAIPVLMVAAFFLLATAGAGPVRAADPNANADELTRRALELRRSGDDEGARPLLRQAYEQSHTPRAAVQLGLCEQALGRWVEAETYLSEGMKADKDPWVVKNRQVLETALGAVKSHISRVEVTGDPTGAEVLINGATVARLPMSGPVRVAAGELQVELRAPGYVTGSKSFRIEGGHYQKVVLRLQPLTPAGAMVGTPGGAAAGSAGLSSAAPGNGAASNGTQTGAAGVGTAATQPETPSPSEGQSAGDNGSAPAWRASLKWVAWGAAAVGLGVGTYGAVRNQSKVKEFDGGCANDSSGMVHVVGTTKTEEQCKGLKNEYQSASRVGIGGFVAAGVLGATGLLLFLTEPHASEAGTAVSFRCAPELSPGRSGVACAWRF